MKTGWVILIAVLSLALGFFAGGFLGTAGGTIGGSLAGVCYTTQVAVKERLLTEEQSTSLLNTMGSKYADSSKKLAVTGDLPQVCKDLLSRSH
jgi:hypothetical protein